MKLRIHRLGKRYGCDHNQRDQRDTDQAALTPTLRRFAHRPLDQALAARGAEPRCGVLVIDTNSGDTVEWLRIEGVVRELFDVAVLPGIRNPAAIGFMTDEIQRVISIDEDGAG